MACDDDDIVPLLLTVLLLWYIVGSVQRDGGLDGGGGCFQAGARCCLYWPVAARQRQRGLISDARWRMALLATDYAQFARATAYGKWRAGAGAAEEYLPDAHAVVAR